ncbi:MAG: hypothetical protein NT080_08545 [Spirochaetes bacterium]|nr:hypothetical protein [Spirochaetota bacterium]
MGIFVTIEDAGGEQLGNVLDIGKIQRHFKAVEGGLCLRFVSEDDDAAFNQRQLPFLVKELEEIDAKVTKAEEKDEIAQLLKLCSKAAGKKNVTVKFYGEMVPD